MWSGSVFTGFVLDVYVLLDVTVTTVLNDGLKTTLFGFAIYGMKPRSPAGPHMSTFVCSSLHLCAIVRTTIRRCIISRDLAGLFQYLRAVSRHYCACLASPSTVFDYYFFYLDILTLRSRIAFSSL